MPRDFTRTENMRYRELVRQGLTLQEARLVVQIEEAAEWSAADDNDE